MRHQRLRESRQGSSRRRGAAAPDDGGHRASGTGRERPLPQRPGGARSPPPLDHRPFAEWRPADAQRGRDPHRHLQRRDLQPSRAARGADREGPRLPLALRYRGTGARLRGMGRGAPRAARRHVCVRHLGRAQTAPLPRPRPARKEAALLPSRPRAAAVLLGDQVPALRRDRSPRSGRRSPGPLPERPVRAGTADDVRRHPEAASRFLRGIRRRRAEDPALLEVRVPRRDRFAHRRRACARALDAPEGRHRGPAHVGRAPRGLPFRGPGFELHRRAADRSAQGAGRGRGEVVLRRLSRGRRQLRAGPGPPGGPRSRYRAPRSGGHRRRLPPLPARSGLAHGRAHRGRGLRAALLSLEARAGRGDRRPLRRRRGRGARRLSRLPHDALDGAAQGGLSPGRGGAAVRAPSQGAQVLALGHAAARAALPGRVGGLHRRREGPPHRAARGARQRAAGEAARAGVGGDRGAAPARADAGARPAHLAAGRSADEGGQDDHGHLAGAAGALPRPPPDRVGRGASGPREAPLQCREVAAPGSRARAAAGGMHRSRQAWLHRARRQLVPQAAPRPRARRPALGGLAGAGAIRGEGRPPAARRASAGQHRPQGGAVRALGARALAQAVRGGRGPCARASGPDRAAKGRNRNGRIAGA